MWVRKKKKKSSDKKKAKEAEDDGDERKGRLLARQPYIGGRGVYGRGSNRQGINDTENYGGGMNGRNFAGRDFLGKDFSGRDFPGREINSRNLPSRDYPGAYPPALLQHRNPDMFNNPNTPDPQEVVKWTITTNRSMLEEATGPMRIHGIPSAFPQLVVTRPTPELETAFAQRASMTGSKPMFHGTPLRNLTSILINGFRGGRISEGARWAARNGRSDEVWMAEEPGFSVIYALKRISFEMGDTIAGGGGGGGMAGEEDVSGNQKGAVTPIPFNMYGAVLGCEWAQPGGYQRGMSAWERGGRRAMEATTDFRSVMVRYVFLVPPDALSSIVTVTNAGNRPKMSSRIKIERQMMENMKQIGARSGRR